VIGDEDADRIHALFSRVGITHLDFKNFKLAASQALVSAQCWHSDSISKPRRLQYSGSVTLSVYSLKRDEITPKR
jgi:hypothetical protein